jgi:hypothetical protein
MTRAHVRPIQWQDTEFKVNVNSSMDTTCLARSSVNLNIWISIDMSRFAQIAQMSLDISRHLDKSRYLLVTYSQKITNYLIQTYL